MSAGAPPSPPQQSQFPCRQCGASLSFSPGTQCLKCPYCGAENEVPASTARVEEQDYRAQLERLAAAEPVHEELAVKCNGCGAETSLPPDTTAGLCPFCGAPIVATGASRKQLRPQSLLPFKVTQNAAANLFRQWVSGLWFAPSPLRRAAERSAIRGAYLPAWTYDSDTASSYSGERGDDYWETETYTEMENGRQVTKTRQVQRTRWTFVSGHVTNRFDDVLVMATATLPPKLLNRLQPWDLPALVPYGDEYLSGFVAESYQVGLVEGFDRAKSIMDDGIRRSVERSIGGDHQRIHSVDTRYDHVTFKHLLLPAWISAYYYQERTYRFVVNARTGQVQGERPYSTWKILLLILTIFVAILIVALIAHARGG